MSGSGDDDQKPINKDHYVAKFEELGAKLLDETEKTNIITLAQFEPYAELFAPDKARIASDDPEYKKEMQRLFLAYRNNLGINFYHPTVVVDRLEKPNQELIFLDRLFSRLAPDVVEGKSARDNVPSNVARVRGNERDEMIFKASVEDVMVANSSDSQKEQFRRNALQSAVFKAMFERHNKRPGAASPETPQTSPDVNPTGPSSSVCDFGLDDDD